MIYNRQEMAKIIWSAEGNPDLTKQQVYDIVDAIINYLEVKNDNDQK